jgi:hypothetical protein
MGSYSTRYSSKSDSKYEMKVPERILVVGEWSFVVNSFSNDVKIAIWDTIIPLV